MVNKKAISPVVATALLLVVAVIAVVGFQGWFGGFITNMQSDADLTAQSTTGANEIDTAVKGAAGEIVVYVMNNGAVDVNSSVAISGCTAGGDSATVAAGSSEAFSLTSCSIVTGEKFTVVLSTDGQGSKQKTFVLN